MVQNITAWRAWLMGDEYPKRTQSTCQLRGVIFRLDRTLFSR